MMNEYVAKACKSFLISLAGVLATYLLAVLNLIDVNLLVPMITGFLTWVVNNLKLLLTVIIENAKKES